MYKRDDPGAWESETGFFGLGEGETYTVESSVPGATPAAPAAPGFFDTLWQKVTPTIQAGAQQAVARAVGVAPAAPSAPGVPRMIVARSTSAGFLSTPTGKIVIGLAVGIPALLVLRQVLRGRG